MSEGRPQDWRKSKITPIYTQKGDPLDCGKYRGYQTFEPLTESLGKSN